MATIRKATFPTDRSLVASLFQEYAHWLGEDLCFQNFDDELASLPGKYREPAGTILLASDEREALGCVALRGQDGDVAEMKRLWVRPKARGAGTGASLVEAVERFAGEAGYAAIVLDTLERLDGALRLYENHGYRRIGAYYHNPIPGAVYLRKDLREEPLSRTAER
ncbi:MAG TPA: GNAT family N-acetyltransferase [Spirochaetia bacterium]|nr:GNAT family N-acetyltransferase [Spirochaetia bacterium]